MHGRPRKSLKAEDPVSSAAKAEKLRHLQIQLLHNHHHRIFDEEALEISSKLLEVNPEVYTAWNYRKIAVQDILGSSDDDELVKNILNRELKIAEVALRRNPKCYGAWYHRKWILKLGFKESDIEREFRLLDQLLKADSRNFHGWNHRRFVAAISEVPEEEELNFTTEKINANFSNYSAWHNRSAILSNLMMKNSSGFVPKEKVITEELEFIHQAIFTDPDDQSGWFYHLWLLDQIKDQDPLALISAWPSRNSEIVLSSNSSVLPIILYFKKSVEYVDLRMVSVESIFTKKDSLVWKPVILNSEEARCFVTYLNINIPELDLNSPEHYSVKVTVRDASSYEFFLKIIPNIRQIDMFLWDDDNFSRVDCLPTELSTSQNSESEISEWCSKTVSGEIILFQELVSEINCKIAKLTLSRLLVKDREQLGEILNLYDDLIRLDPSHDGYYKDQRSLILIKQMTSDEESLRKHCFLLKESSSKKICLRLNNLSLTRIGFIDRLLWVNTLDLSHNELRSIEGLEAMQLLSHLNLSYNKLSSITALEPLKLMTSLQVLNISYNEIGAHTIDSKRYLSGSLPLSHRAEGCGIFQNFDDYNDEEINLHWDAILIFRNMHLTQLDVMGNQILTDSFRTLMIKLIPSLEWFDGYPINNLVNYKA